MQYDVAGLGNALVDALVVLDDDTLLEALGLVRGTMHPVDDARWNEVFDRVRHLDVVLDSGGSCANAVATAGLLGTRAIYCGRVGDDDMGRMYEERMLEACGHHALQWTPGQPTGKCLSMISAVDAERTLVTDLGAASTIPDIDRFTALVERSRVAHFTGYTLFDPSVQEQVEHAMRFSRDRGCLVSLDAADPIVVKLQRDLLWHLVEDYADLVFLNAEEATMLTDATPEEAILRIGERVGRGTVVVKLGARGSLVLHQGRLHEVRAEGVRAVDTTGAGDAYAGGYLHGYVAGLAPDRCGRLASTVAARAVSQVGARVRDRELLRGISRRAGGPG